MNGSAALTSLSSHDEEALAVARHIVEPTNPLDALQIKEAPGRAILKTCTTLNVYCGQLSVVGDVEQVFPIAR